MPVVERLRAKYDHVRWIKEAGGSVDRVDQLKRAMGDDITVLSGDDVLTLPYMAVGAEGVISVASNLVIREVAQLVRLARANDFAKARKLHRQLYPLFKALFLEGFARQLEGVRLIMLANDVSLRHLVSPELAKGFGFLQSKPATAFSPVAVTLPPVTLAVIPPWTTLTTPVGRSAAAKASSR